METESKCEVFEVHITGDQSIINAATSLGYKTITIDLLKPDKSVLRQEYMTSQIFRFKTYAECKSYVDGIVQKLKDLGVEIIRVKIESPDYDHYRAQSCYMESHFENIDDAYPMSRNVRKTTILATSRECDKESYDAFHKKYENAELELCLFDTFIDEDLDWFILYTL